MRVIYAYDELASRIEEINKGPVILSNQYGMLFLLNTAGEILLNLSGLVDKKEREAKS